MKPKNVIISQSGGPTSVINNSLRGVIEGLEKYRDKVGTIYAGFHGVEGILREELLNLSVQPREEIALLETTPASGSIGTCRYKLQSHYLEDFQRILNVLQAHQVGYLFYIGGNDSMDTAGKIAGLAREKGLSLVATGVPKTIDNDVGDQEFRLIDHTPGYGSAAKYWAHTVQIADEENRGSYPADPVLVIQAMGRKIGFIPAAARLADPNRTMPLLIILSEAGLTLEEIHERVNRKLREAGRAILVVGEGINVGKTGQVKDSFGHTSFGSSKLSAAQMVAQYLNEKGLAVRGHARYQIPGTDQRGCIQLASRVDLDEAYQLGRHAAVIALEEGSGFMSTILRMDSPGYRVSYGKVSLELVANSERTFPLEWLTEDKTDVTDNFLRYAVPLIGEEWVRIPMEKGLMRFSRLRPVFEKKKLGDYIPCGYRERD